MMSVLMNDLKKLSEMMYLVDSKLGNHAVGDASSLVSDEVEDDIFIEPVLDEEVETFVKYEINSEKEQPEQADIVHEEVNETMNEQNIVETDSTLFIVSDETREEEDESFNQSVETFVKYEQPEQADIDENVEEKVNEENIVESNSILFTALDTDVETISVVSDEAANQLPTSSSVIDDVCMSNDDKFYGDVIDFTLIHTIYNRTDSIDRNEMEEFSNIYEEYLDDLSDQQLLMISIIVILIPCFAIRYLFSCLLRNENSHGGKVKVVHFTKLSTHEEENHDASNFTPSHKSIQSVDTNFLPQCMEIPSCSTPPLVRATPYSQSSNSDLSTSSLYDHDPKKLTFHNNTSINNQESPTFTPQDYSEPLVSPHDVTPLSSSYHSVESSDSIEFEADTATRRIVSSTSRIASGTIDISINLLDGGIKDVNVITSRIRNMNHTSSMRAPHMIESIDVRTVATDSETCHTSEVSTRQDGRNRNRRLLEVDDSQHSQGSVGDDSCLDTLLERCELLENELEEFKVLKQKFEILEIERDDYENLQERCNDLENKLVDFERLKEGCKLLEDELEGYENLKEKCDLLEKKIMEFDRLKHKCDVLENERTYDYDEVQRLRERCETLENELDNFVTLLDDFAKMKERCDRLENELNEFERVKERCQILECELDEYTSVLNDFERLKQSYDLLEKELVGFEELKLRFEEIDSERREFKERYEMLENEREELLHETVDLMNASEAAHKAEIEAILARKGNENL
jgi:hypothetical protein